MPRSTFSVLRYVFAPGSRSGQVFYHSYYDILYVPVAQLMLLLPENLGKYWVR